MAVIITGDIIGSSQLAAAQRQERLNALLIELFSTLKSVWRQQDMLRTEFVQGDAFQVYLKADAEGMRAALLIKSFFLAQDKVSTGYRFDCRLSIGVEAISLLHPDSLAQSGGLAFDYSGRGLKNITRTGPQFWFKSGNSALNKAMAMGLALIDEIIRRWTPLQSQAIVLSLTYPAQTNEWLAGRIGITRSAYSQRLRQAGWSAIQQLLEYYLSTVNLS